MNGVDYLMRRRDQGPISPLRERLRFLVLLIGTGAGIWLATTRDSIWAQLAMPVGVWMLTYGLTDLVWLTTGDLERIWTKTRRSSVVIASLLYWVGGAILFFPIREAVVRTEGGSDHMTMYTNLLSLSEVGFFFFGAVASLVMVVVFVTVRLRIKTVEPTSTQQVPDPGARGSFESSSGAT